MNKMLIAVLVSMALTGCGGGGSDKNTAAEPPAPETPAGNNNGGGGNSGDSGDQGAAPQPEEPVPLAMDCNKQPGGSINSGSEAKATFKANQPINTTGILSMACPGSTTVFADKSVDVISGQALVKQAVPAGCEGFTLNVGLVLSEEAIVATCSWPVNESLDFQFGG